MKVKLVLVALICRSRAWLKQPEAYTDEATGETKRTARAGDG